MKQPKRSNLKISKKGTQAIRKKAAALKKIKITINFDSDILNETKKLANQMGTPYQTLLNKILRDALLAKKAHDDRLGRIEREISALKKKIA